VQHFSNSQSAAFDEQHVQVLRQRPMEPKRGMVYDVLVHILSVVVMRRHGPDARPLFYPFHFNPGATNADQAVAPEPAPIEPQAVAVSGAEEQLPRAPAPPRNSCSAEYWRPHHRDHNNNNDDDDEDGGDGRGGRAFAPQRRSLFQRIRWPADKGRSRERSPWHNQGESSRHGGRRHDRERFLSPATRRSRERSLDRFVHRILRREPQKNEEVTDLNKHQGPWGLCMLTPPSPNDRPDSGSTGSITLVPASPDVDSFNLLRLPEHAPQLDFFDPMLQEAVSLETNKGRLTPAGEAEEGQEQLQMDNRLPLPEVEYARENGAVPTQGGVTSQLAGFIQEVTQQPEAAILPTPKKRRQTGPSANRGSDGSAQQQACKQDNEEGPQNSRGDGTGAAL
jgi:hypothetical protein